MAAPKKTKAPRQLKPAPSKDELIKFLLTNTTLLLLIIVVMAAVGGYLYVNVWAASP